MDTGHLNTLLTLPMLLCVCVCACVGGGGGGGIEFEWQLVQYRGWLSIQVLVHAQKYTRVKNLLADCLTFEGS